MNNNLPNEKMYSFLLERNKKYMNNIALTFENKIITYEELHQRINDYANALHKYGINKGDKVAVCLINNPESVYIIYALNKIGAVTIGLSPLNNKYKMNRDLEMTKPKYLISADMFYSNEKDSCKKLNIIPLTFSPLESSDKKIMKYMYDMKQILSGNHLINSNVYSIISKNKKSNYEFDNSLNPNETTDIMFTGGSSGIHKGVCLNENGLNCVVQALDDVLILEPGMTHLGNIPFGHMAFGKLVLHYSLCNNLNFALSLDPSPQNFYNLLKNSKANGAMGGPIHWEGLLDSNVEKDSLRDLIQPLSGGEYFKPDKRESVNKKLEYAGCNVPVGDGLGLTEMWAPINVNVGGKNTPGTVGNPIPYVDEKIIELNGNNEVQQGMPGLLYVHGPGMMLGYYNNETENDKVFSVDLEGKKWYCTGDIVRKINDSGELEYIGRKKRNFVSVMDNIYPEQIEKILQDFDEIDEVCVTKIPDEKEQYLPKYHIVLKNDNCDTEKLIKKINYVISSTLGHSSLPGYISFENEKFPRTDNGKMNVTLIQEQDLMEKETCLKLKR